VAGGAEPELIRHARHASAGWHLRRERTSFRQETPEMPAFGMTKLGRLDNRPPLL
jgi:hypothetical protein